MLARHAHPMFQLNCPSPFAPLLPRISTRSQGERVGGAGFPELLVNVWRRKRISYSPCLTSGIAVLSAPKLPSRLGRGLILPTPANPLPESNSNFLDLASIEGGMILDSRYGDACRNTENAPHFASWAKRSQETGSDRRLENADNKAQHRK